MIRYIQFRVKQIVQFVTIDRAVVPHNALMDGWGIALQDENGYFILNS